MIIKIKNLQYILISATTAKTKEEPKFIHLIFWRASLSNVIQKKWTEMSSNILLFACACCLRRASERIYFFFFFSLICETNTTLKNDCKI